MRKKKGGDHENHERWLLTYADMITLLMAFFIMMYSMSVLNMSKFREAAIAIRSGFGGIVKGQARSVLGSSGSYSVRPSPMSGDTAVTAWRAVRPLVKFIQRDRELSKNAQVSMDQRGIVVSILSDNMLFESGSADIREGAHPLLNKIAEMLDKISNCIRVEGHTCDLPPRSGARYPTNWELSTARAINVLRYLVDDKGLDSRLFSVAGYAGQQPRVPNTSERNRRKNRRVDIVIVAEDGLRQQKPAVELDIAGEAFPVDKTVSKPGPAGGEIRSRTGSSQ